VLLGTFVIADYLPWLRPMDLGGTEKRMQQLRVRLDAFCTEIIEEHEVKRLKGPIAEQDKSMIDLLLNEMHEQDNVDPIDLDNLRSTIIVRLIRISNTHEPSLLL
jgi:cytochrome P450 family 1 subfamily A polypeptide 1